MNAFLLIILSSLPSIARAAPVDLLHPVECTLSAVAERMEISLQKENPFPAVFLASETPLAQFQDAVEPQWLFRPEKFLNAFIAEKNEIYLMNDGTYYAKTGRFLDDSLAHELAHYIQVKYKKVTLATADDSVEVEAVTVQTWFRETYMKTGKSPCAKY